MPNDFNSGTITTPILIHFLKGELLFPELFILRCKLTLGQLKQRIDKRFPQEFGDLATLPLWVYLNLKNKIGERNVCPAREKTATDFSCLVQYYRPSPTRRCSFSWLETGSFTCVLWANQRSLSITACAFLTTEAVNVADRTITCKEIP